MSGYIKLHRGYRDNPVLASEFSRGDAWVWLIENAAWKPTRARIKGVTVVIDRGELTFSVRFLAEAWGWSKSRVDRFLNDLRDEGMIETRSKIGTLCGTDSGTTIQQKAGQGQSIIKLCNYEKYQSGEDDMRDDDDTERGTLTGTGSGTSAGRARDKEEERNNTLPNGKGAEAPNLTEKLWCEGLAVVTACDVPEAKARPLLGKWRKAAVDRLGKDEGEARIIALLAQAQRESVSDLVPWMEAATRNLAGPQRRETSEERAKREHQEHIARIYGPDSPRAKLAAGAST